MVMVVRSDLKMKPGKIAAQCGHATLGAYKTSLKRRPEYVRAWQQRGQAKIVLRANHELFQQVVDACKEAGLVASVVVDAGRTQVRLHSDCPVLVLLFPAGFLTRQHGCATLQIPAGSETVIGIGPAPVAEIDAITGRGGSCECKLMS